MNLITVWSKIIENNRNNSQTIKTFSEENYKIINIPLTLDRKFTKSGFGFVEK